MKDRRPLDELSIQELEEALRLRRRQERLRRLREDGLGVDTQPPADRECVEGAVPKSSEQGHRRFPDTGATATYRARAVWEGDEGMSGEARRRAPFFHIQVEWPWLRDRSLLVVELAVLGALIVVLGASMVTLRKVNDASSSAQGLSTLTPTPPIGVLLPGGHTPPDASGEVATAEVPAHLQNLVSAVTPLPVPTPGPEHATRIQIPAIGVDAPVLEGDDWETLKRGAGHHIGSANPGERGNCVISAHNDIFGSLFRDLPQLDRGDEVIVHTSSRAYRYVITQKRVVEPTAVEVLAPTSSPVLTLLTCYPYGVDTHRMVVIGEFTP